VEGARQPGGQQLRIYGTPLGDGSYVLHEVLQLADVARPVVLVEPRSRALGDRERRPPCAPSRVVQEALRQDRKLALSRAQRPDVHDARAEPVVEILSKPASRNFGEEVPVRGR